MKKARNSGDSSGPALILLAQLERLGEQTELRERRTQELEEGLKQFEGIC